MRRTRHVSNTSGIASGRIPFISLVHPHLPCCTTDAELAQSEQSALDMVHMLVRDEIEIDRLAAELRLHVSALPCAASGPSPLEYEVASIIQLDERSVLE